ncbi:MAG: hypothetical protein KDG89_10675 [Geminicoccaceae bacterium]|nr:hypothetical protein [Geminicoccaceae bacterium]
MSRTNLLAAAVGVALFLFFLGAIAWKVHEPPLLVIMAVVAVMAVADIVRALRAGE